MNAYALNEKVAAIVETKLVEALAEISRFRQQRLSGVGPLGAHHVITQISGSFSCNFQVAPKENLLKVTVFESQPKIRYEGADG